MSYSERMRVAACYVFVFPLLAFVWVIAVACVPLVIPMCWITGFKNPHREAWDLMARTPWMMWREIRYLTL